MAEADGFPAQEEQAGSDVGRALRTAREQAGKTVEELAAQTRIPRRHISSLEAGDVAALPGRPYAIGFARTLARALDLDEAKTVDGVRAALDAQGPAEPARTVQQFEVGDPAKTPGGATIWIAATVALLVVVAGMVFWRSYYAPAGGLPSLLDRQAGAADLTLHQAAASPAPVAPAAPADGAVVFTALDDNVWVKFYDGTGTQLMQKQMAKGESYTVPADAHDPKVWTGRPDAFAITIGGKAVPPLADRQMIMKDVPVGATALLARAAPAGPLQPASQASSSTATM